MKTPIESHVKRVEFLIAQAEADKKMSDPEDYPMWDNIISEYKKYLDKYQKTRLTK